MLRYYFLLFFLTFYISGFTQTPGFTQFTIENGIPSNTVYDIEQDENGYIWLATDYGISKFDGKTFKNYTINDGLPDNEILTLFKDSKNRIWTLGFNGKTGYILEGKFYNSTNSLFLNDLVFNSFISEIYEDSKNNLWFLRSLNSIKKLDKNNKITNHQFKINRSKNQSKIIKLLETKDGSINVVISTTQKESTTKALMASLNDTDWQEFDINLFSNKELCKLFEKKAEGLKKINEKATYISNIIFEKFNYTRANNLIYNTKIIDSTTFLISNLDEGSILIKTDQPTQNSIKLLPTIQTTVSYIDNEKNVWIGSHSNGIFLFPNIKINGVQFKNKKKNDLHSVIEFNNNIVIGNELGELILIDKKTLKKVNQYKTDKFTERIRHLKKSSDLLFALSDQNISSLNSKFEFTSVQNMYGRKYQKTALKNFKDISILNNQVYTANSNGVSTINTKSCNVEKLWNQRSSAILSVNKDSIWVGTTTGLYLKKADLIEPFSLNPEFDNSIIYSLKTSSNGLLIGSNSFGLGVLNNGKFKTISTKNGLLSNYIKSIHVDENNAIWLSTNFGLNYLKLDENNNILKIKSYTSSDGLYSNDVRGSFVDHKKNTIYIATSKGLNIIDLTKENGEIPPPILHLNEISVNNNPIKSYQNQSFKFDFNNFQFSYSGISFKSLGNVSFKYRLKGLETDWIETKNNTVRYSGLPPNDYTFEIIAVSKNKTTNKAPLSFSFTISPVFYKTVWFISLLFLSVVLLVFLLQKSRINKLKKEQKIKEQISALKYRALNAQMNPHFINNLAINISSLADKGQFSDVQKSLKNYSELVNLVLQSTKSNLINLSDEIEMCMLYLDLQKVRFKDHLSYTINWNKITVDEQHNILVPPMIFQPIIENSIKHGFKSSKKLNKIEINFNIQDNDFLVCEILDNGIGIDPSNLKTDSTSTGISLENINQRLQLISDSNSKEKFVFTTNLKNEFNKLEGSKVTLKIPLISY